MQFLQEYNFFNKRTLVRSDFNVPIINGKIVDDFRLYSCVETIRYLQKQQAKIILIGHLGRPLRDKGSKKSQRLKKKEFSLMPVAMRLQDILGEPIKFIKDCIGSKPKRAIKKMKQGDIIMLENLRFHKGEVNNSSDFLKKLSDLGDCFVQNDFSVCHRKHASVVGLPNVLPKVAGLSLEKEVEELSNFLENIARPFIVIISGAKVPSKIKVVSDFLNLADHILIGGKVANMILRVKGIAIGKSWPSKDVIEIIKEMDITNQKIHLPVDVLCSPNKQGDIYIRDAGPGFVRQDEEILDIGDETIEEFSRMISSAKSILWSGPIGFVENKRFRKGTIAIAKSIIANKNAFKIVGGGNTVAFLRENNLLSGFSYVSTGGGAMLEYLTGKKLPGLQAL